QKDDTSVFAFRRLHSDPPNTTKPHDASTPPTRVSSTANGGARRDVSTLKPRERAVEQRGDAPRAPVRARPVGAEAPIITPADFVVQLTQKCEKLLPAAGSSPKWIKSRPEVEPSPAPLPRKAGRLSLALAHGGRRSVVPSAPRSN
ncbi:hypothetical protein T484DRAFT_1871449, partial [Baffinella frigidus]